MHHTLRRVLLSILTVLFCLAPAAAFAQNTPCTVGPATSLSCSGNQSSGILATTPFTTLNVNTLTGAITQQPIDGWGIRLTGVLGVPLTINSGTSVFPITINPTSQLGIGGISAFSLGIPGADGDDACNLCTGFLDLEGRSSTNGGPGGAGGSLFLNSFANITAYQTQAVGIFGYSVGGTGGQGGDATTGRNSKSGGQGGAGGAITINGSGSITTWGSKGVGILGLSEGGKGGGGGDGAIANSAEDGGPGGQGGVVNILGHFNITTHGAEAYGIWGKALGGIAGGGGDGGWTGTGAGNGGTGSAGGSVSITATGAIVTTGSDAIGIYAESIGGFGGSGGDGTSIFYSAGGSGASAGSGGNVTVNNSGTITTGNARSHGIFAQSVGGGGGTGGSGGGAISSLGGGGSTGGNGGQVRVTNTGAIIATGAGSRGIYAQSLGGGGGDGGSSAGIESIGGNGSATSDGSTVMVKNTADIASADSAIFAQSIGGGGGNGGSSSGWFSFGGKGGGGGNAGLVMLTSHGTLSTFENNANGIFAQSLGGGGGNGGNSTAVGAFVAVAVGGEGAKGGLGRDVLLGYNPDTFLVDPITGSIFTSGKNANGILAQSIGGGGGNGGFAVSVAAGIGGAAALGIGGKGGGGNSAGNTTLFFGNASSQIVTTGENSNGIFAQSVGGGGGTGGFSIAAAVSNKFTAAISLGGNGGTGGNAGVVTLGSIANPIFGSIYTFGSHSYGLLAQSVGGGGGNGGMAIAGSASLKGINFAMGGDGTGGGNANQVFLTNGAFVQTMRDDSHGIFAQSLGGGGGAGGFSVAAGVSLEGSVNIGIGGKGGPGGDAQTVFLQNLSTGTVNTFGNHAYGILAQSVGGGGGDGGFAIAGGIGAGTTANFGIGGNGATGGTSQNVTVINNGALTTSGEASHGLFAQSVGGGGGSGGFGIAGAISTGNEISFSMGGKGGSGGGAGSVNVTNTGAITTGGLFGTGKGSYGISAQSIGGGGGSGGFAGSFSVLLGSSGNAVSLSLGGDGGSGGAAQAVSVINSGGILTRALGSVGLFAQSIGGGGGDGGFALAFSLTSGPQKASASITLGGKGAHGGDGATVGVTNSQSIETQGDNSQGILAQSIGAGGGNGGFAISTALATGDEAKSLSLALGGQGGQAGDGKAVTVTNSAHIQTSGDDSSAIHAQSIGKGGGNGGFSFAGSLAGTSGKSFAVTMGGGGGGGGKGDVVNVFGSGGNALVTFGDRSHGVEAQSIGGGGGNGGFAISGALGFGGNDPNKPSTSIALALGGLGGVGNTGGTVNIGTIGNVFTGSITTNGQESIGILAQSLGGGGGNGGFSFAGTLNFSAGQKGPNTDLSIAVGGDGGAGNNGGIVNVYHSGGILTAGDGSHGIEAQSIGGGGGNGGSSRAVALQLGSEQPKAPKGEKQPGKENMSLAVAIGGDGHAAGDGSTVNVVHTGDITTGGGDAYGIFAQSIGGGGGTGGDANQGFDGQFLLRKYDRAQFQKSVKFVLGGSGGASGNGGSVLVSNTGTITTYGFGSFGVFAQSIGGGGGAGGSGGLELGLGLFSGGIGGAAGTTGDGKDVTVNVNGAINTFGEGAQGIFAESVGGGGGKGGSVERGLKSLNIGFGLAYGRGGGNGGDGGAVTVNSNAAIHTSGSGATGIFAHSVGGGGGVVGETGNDDIPVLSLLNFTGSVGGDGSGGVVTVNQTGNISTTGEWADGIFAQSAGGTGFGRAVNVTLNSGNIIVGGTKSDGIVAQSLGMSGKGDITVNLASTASTIQGGKDDGAAVRFLDGNNNLLTNKGTLTTLKGLDGTSFVGTTGNDTIDNFGLYMGSLDAGTGTNTFNNKSGGRINTGTSINLGNAAGSFFNNAGTLSFGLFGDFKTTSVVGNFGQSGTPRWLVDIGEVGSSDAITFTGHAELGSSATRVDLNELTLPTQTGAYNLLTAAQGGLSASAGNFTFGTLFGAMPLGRTFEFAGSTNATKLMLLPSVGAFQWSGANSSSWITPFVDGVSNWTRSGGTDYVFGTPGAGADVVFSATGLTTMGADFNVNSLRFTGVGSGASHTLAAGNILTIFGAGGRGLTIDPGSMPTTVSVNIVLGGNQSWMNNGAGLLAINGQSITGAGRNLTIDGTGLTNIVAPIQTGSGSLTKSGSGLLILSGANTYSGGTIVNGGMVLGDTTSLQGNFLNNALVVFDQAATGTFAGNMAGSGGLLKQAGGLLILTGANSYAGGTVVNGGTLMVTAASLPGNVLNQTSLIFNQTTGGTFGGSITGAGLLTKQGGGALTLSGNSSQFTGNTIVTGGQLFVNGLLGGQSLVLTPGTLLGGNGFIPKTTIQSGAVLSPGNSIGTLFGTSDVAFDANSVYRVETESYGPSDHTIVTGRLTPVGAIVDVQAGGDRRYRPINKYNIFRAESGVAGVFAGITSSLSYLNPSLQYDPTNVYLTLRRNDVDFRDDGTEGNQTRVAEVLNDLVAVATDAVADVVNNVYDLSNADALSAMSSMTGIIHQHVARNALDVPRMFIGANMRRLGAVTAGRGSLIPNAGLAFNASPSASADPIANDSYGFWLSGLTGATNYRGTKGDAGAKAPSHGFVAGFDRAIAGSLTLGVSGGESSPEITLDALPDQSTAKMKQFGVYGRYAHSGSRVDGVLGVSGYDNSTSRIVTDGASVAGLKSNYRSMNLAAQLEYGRSFKVGGGFVVEPQAGLQYGRVRFDGFNEEGATVLALSVPGRIVGSNRLLTGSRLARGFAIGSTKMMLEGRAAWAHDFSTIADLPVKFQGDPFTNGFNLAPTAQLRSGAVLGTGFVGDAPGNLRFFADFQGELSGPVKGWNGNIGATKSW